MRRKLAAVGGSYLIGLIFASIFFDFAIFLICGVILLVAVAIITAILTRKYDISAALLCCAAGITVFSCVSLSMAKAAEPLLNGTYDITATVAQKQVIGNDSAVFKVEGLGKMLCNKHNVFYYTGISFIKLIDTGDMFFGNDKDMYRCHRINILESDYFIALIYLFGRDLA